MLNMNPDDKQMPAPKVRPATQAGSFYENDPKVLAKEVDGYLARHAKDASYANLAAVIVPHAGHYFSGNVAASAYAAIPRGKQYKRIFMLGPSHYEWLNGASVNTEVDYYATPLGQVKVDRETGRQLTMADSVFTYRAKSHDREHCLEVQLPFLQRHMKQVPPIVPIIISTNDFTQMQRMAEVLKPYFNEENLFVISSDFSHYPAYKDAYKADGKTRDAILTGDVEKFILAVEENRRSGIPNLSTSACGEDPIITLMLMLNQNYDIKHLLYQNSGDIDHHDPRRVVGYHAFAFLRKVAEKNVSAQKDSAAATEPLTTGFTLTDSDKTMLKQIARESIMAGLDGKSYLPDSKAIADSNPTLTKKCGAFVTLTQRGQLRGCIGLMNGSLPLYETVAEMAHSAAFDDPRFDPLRRGELDKTDIEISVITPMRRIKTIDEFELHRHGIYIKKGYRSGTFLPQVADEVNWTKEEFLGHCSRDKAGLGWNGWRDAELYVYEAIVF